MRLALAAVSLSLFILSCTHISPPLEVAKDLPEEISLFVTENRGPGFDDLLPSRVTVESVEVTDDDALVTVSFSPALVEQPVRLDTDQRIADLLRPIVDRHAASAEIVILANGLPLDRFVPRAYGGAGPERDRSAEIHMEIAAPLAQPMRDLPLDLSGGLQGRHIALWHSHGWYYSENDDRWTWQRPRMFTAVEDKLPMSFVLPHLVPMLENAGAVALLPRERDPQPHEVIVDDEGDAELSGAWDLSEEAGFRAGIVPLPKDVNPHAEGHFHTAVCDSTESSSCPTAMWVPEIPADGDYSVTVCYDASSDRAPDAPYVIRHAGGASEVRVNQRIGGHTWVYLGTFTFRQGSDPTHGSVQLLASSQTPGATVSADAVRFGGGMGIVEMGGRTSGYPRFLEATQYVIQHGGAPPELTYRTGEDWNEYTQDYAGRPEWVNWLNGAPNGPNADRDDPGLGIPIDLSFAFHTDAGIKDGIAGTLMLTLDYGQHRETNDNDEVIVADTEFPDGRPRWLNRELGDLIQTQVVEDVRTTFSPAWTRRQLQNRSLAEHRRPNVPSALIELASHQNFDDQTALLDPRFRFVVARAIYKGMLRFIASENGFDPIVQPLAPTHFAVEAVGPGEFQLSWQPQSDPLEPTAEPDGYLVYHREGGPIGDRWYVTRGGGFGEPLSTTESTLLVGGLDPEVIHSFRVTAANRGGESFPTTTLAAAWGGEGAPTALVVDAFDRLAPPRIIDIEGEYEGFDRATDRGVGYGVSFSLAGDQWDFDPADAWSGETYFTNDHPGHGASSGDLEAAREVGNLFDHTALHAGPLHALGFTVSAITDEALEAGGTPTADLLDWVLGEERQTSPPSWMGASATLGVEFEAIPPAHRQIITAYLEGGGRLILSGAHWATDVANPMDSQLDPEGEAFLRDVLGVTWRADQASTTGRVIVLPERELGAVGDFAFEAGLGTGPIYGCESPDALAGASVGERNSRVTLGHEVLRYANARMGAAVLSEGTTPGRTLSFGFPLECVADESARTDLFGAATAALMGE